jgi:PAS domain S-box-containing protein
MPEYKNNSQKEIAILNQLIAVQSMLSIFSEPSKMCEFVINALKMIPGVVQSNICLRNYDYQLGDRFDLLNETCTTLYNIPNEITNYNIILPKEQDLIYFTLKTTKRLYGVLTLKITDMYLFNLYMSAVSNFINIISLNLENNWQKTELEKHQAFLEKQVKDRTSELHSEKVEHKKAEISLKKTEVKYKELANSISDIFFALDRDLNYTFWNKASEDLTGILAEDALGKSLYDLFPDIRDSIAEKMYLEALNTNTTKTFVQVFEIQNQSFYFEMSVYPTNEGISVFSKNITERKLSEEAFIAYNTKLEIAMKSAKMAWWELDLITHKVKFDSRKAEMLGYLPEKFVDYEDFTALLHPDDFELAMNAMHKHLKGEDNKYEIEYRILNIFGEYKWFYDYGTVSKKDDNGTPLMVLGFVLDINERKRHESITSSRLHLIEFSLKHSLDDLLEETLNQTEILTGSKIGFYHFVEDDQISLTLQNWSTRTKRDFCKAEGKGLHYPISDAGVWTDCVKNRKPVIHNDYPSLMHKKGLPEGHAPVLREIVVPVFRGNKIKAILGVGNKATDYTDWDLETVSLFADIVWEITERKFTEEALKKSEQKLSQLNIEKDKFFSIIAHDLKNPLGSFRELTKLLHDSYQDFEEQERIEYLDLMKTSSDNLYNLLWNLLEWTNFQKGKIDYNPQKVNIFFVVNEIIELVSLSARNKSIQLKNSIISSVEIISDPNHLTFIIRNLLTNAIKYTPQNGLIEIGINNEDSNQSKIYKYNNSEICIYIKDSGIGMSQSIIDKLFHIDTSFTTPGTDQEKGTGLGLILCKEFVEKNGGKIWAESSPGNGSIFYFTLNLK